MSLVVHRHGDRTTLTQLPGDHYIWQCSLSTFMAPVDNQNPFASLGRVFRKTYIEGTEPSPGNCYAGKLPSILSPPLPSLSITLLTELLGELTIRGFGQHVEYGQNLRQLYVDNYQFLPPTINYSLMGIRSTDVPRTLASAQV